MPPVRLAFNPAGLAGLLISPTSPVARDLERRGKRVESQAKINATGPPGPNVRTGRLRSSITASSAQLDAGGLYVDVGSDVEYAAIIEGGGVTPPHYIRPRFARALWWEGADHPVQLVFHPGSVFTPRPYLGPALRAAL